MSCKNNDCGKNPCENTFTKCEILEMIKMGGVASDVGNLLSQFVDVEISPEGEPFLKAIKMLIADLDNKVDKTPQTEYINSLTIPELMAKFKGVI